jgi:hypothetical protein
VPDPPAPPGRGKVIAAATNHASFCEAMFRSIFCWRDNSGGSQRFRPVIIVLELTFNVRRAYTRPETSGGLCTVTADLLPPFT